MAIRTSKHERFSDAYLQAVAAIAGYAVAKPNTDDDKIDWTISASLQSGLTRRPKLDVQLKCTWGASVGADEVTYWMDDLGLYERLRHASPCTPHILVVMVVPEDETVWLTQSRDELVMRQCAWWISYRGAEPATATTGVTCKIPCGQIFDVAGLKGMMNRIDAGGYP